MQFAHFHHPDSSTGSNPSPSSTPNDGGCRCWKVAASSRCLAANTTIMVSRHFAQKKMATMPRVEDMFDVGGVIGEGTYGVVFKAKAKNESPGVKGFVNTVRFSNLVVLGVHVSLPAGTKRCVFPPPQTHPLHTRSCLSCWPPPVQWPASLVCPQGHEELDLGTARRWPFHRSNTGNFHSPRHQARQHHKCAGHLPEPRSTRGLAPV